MQVRVRPQPSVDEYGPATAAHHDHVQRPLKHFRRQEFVLQPSRPNGRLDVVRNSSGWNWKHPVADHQHVNLADTQRVARRNQLIMCWSEAVLCSSLFCRERVHRLVPFVVLLFMGLSYARRAYAAAALIGTDQPESSITCAGAAANSWPRSGFGG